jgi:hypothetical protein
VAVKKSKENGKHEELVRQLVVLRSDINSIIDHCRINSISRVEEMLRLLERKDTIGDEQPEPEEKDIEEMLEKLDELRIKPKKGRLKDLKRIDALLDELFSHFSSL